MPKTLKRPTTLKVLSVRWGNPTTVPPADSATLESDSRCRWVVTLLGGTGEAEMFRDHAPDIVPGSGWTWTVSFVSTRPPRRWSAEAKGRVRRANLKRRLDAKVPLLAELLFERALAERPDYFRLVSFNRSADE